MTRTVGRQSSPTAMTAQGSRGPKDAMKLPALGEKVPRRGNSATRFLGRLVLRRLGWRIEGDVPDVPRCVAIVAPHTSNWDFVIGIAALLALGLRGRWLGKRSEEHTSELQSLAYLVCRLLLEKK